MKKVYIQYGCGLVAPQGWINFDASPTLRIQKLPVLGKILRPYFNCVFPEAVRYGDIVKGLPIADNSCDGVFCSHVLEHLPLDDFYKALQNTYRILKPGSVFRCILPDLEVMAREYIEKVCGYHVQCSAEDDERGDVCINFVERTLLGMKHKPRGLKGLATLLLGNSGHRWMWDKYSLTKALSEQGFVDIQSFLPNSCEDEIFLLPEDEGNFNHSFALQCRKPINEKKKNL